MAFADCSLPVDRGARVDLTLKIRLGRAIVPPSEVPGLAIPLSRVASLRGVPATAQALTASAVAGFRFSGTPATSAL
jgi:hypothetical protein